MKSLRLSSYRPFGLLVWALALTLLGQPIAPLSVTHGAPGVGRATTSEKPTTTSAPDAATKARVEENYGKLPLSFEANKGQTDARVKFISRGQGYSFFLTPSEAVMTLNRAEAKEQGARAKKETSATLRMKLVGANEQPRISGLDEQAGKTNYFLGNDARQWKTDVPNYGKVKYEGVYPGVDVVYYGNQQQLEYDFIVAPGADPKQIKLSFAGARQMRLDENGDLILKTQAGEVRQHKPIVYQEENGKRREITSRYVLAGHSQVHFKIGEYDVSQPLVIDPILSYSTFLGGKYDSNPEGITVDAAGNAYVTGRIAVSATEPTEFPTTQGSLQMASDPTRHEGNYTFVTKFNADGSALLYSAIIGGTRGIPYLDSRGQTRYELTNSSQDIAIDTSGNAYVTGWTRSTNFPTTPGAVQAQTKVTTRDASDAFVVKLNPSGSAVVYATLLGQGKSAASSIAINNSGEAWLTGATGANNFPTTRNAYQNVLKSPGASAFVSKLNSTGTQLLYSTYLTSGSGDGGNDIAVDASGNAYVTGSTGSSCDAAGRPPVDPFPTTEGAFRRDLGDGCVGTGSSRFTFVTKFDSGGAVVYSTLVGISVGEAIAVDAAGNAYVAGKTVKGTDFPITPDAFQTQITGATSTSAGFVTKLNANGSGLVYSTYINGVGNNPDLIGLAIDTEGSAYVTGYVSTVNKDTFVTTSKDAPFNSPVGIFATKLNPAASALVYSVILGQGRDPSIAVDGRGNTYLAGVVGRDVSFPTTPNAFQTQRNTTNPSGSDAFVSKIGAVSAPRPVQNVSAASYAGAALASDSIVTAFGSGLASALEVAVSNPLPTTLAGTTLKVKDSAGTERSAALFFVSPTQINYLIPSGTASGQATVTVTSADGIISTASVQIENVAPGLFAADASGRGVAAAVVLRVKANGEQVYEPVARFDPSQNKMVAVPIDLGPEGEQVFLIAYGTGLRYRSGLNGVNLRLGGTDAQVLYAGPQNDFVGLDQSNVRIPRSLAGRGEVDILLSMDGRTANTVKVWIK